MGLLLTFCINQRCPIKAIYMRCMISSNTFCHNVNSGKLQSIISPEIVLCQRSTYVHQNLNRSFKKRIRSLQLFNICQILTYMYTLNKLPVNIISLQVNTSMQSSPDFDPPQSVHQLSYSHFHNFGLVYRKLKQAFD